MRRSVLFFKVSIVVSSWRDNSVGPVVVPVSLPLQHLRRDGVNPTLFLWRPPSFQALREPAPGYAATQRMYVMRGCVPDAMSLMYHNQYVSEGPKGLLGVYRWSKNRRLPQ